VIFKLSLPSVEKKHSAKNLFADCYIFDTWQRSSLPSEQRVLSPSVFFYRGFFVWHSPKSFFVECPKKQSAKYLVLDKEPNFGSDHSSSPETTLASPRRCPVFARQDRIFLDPFRLYDARHRPTRSRHRSRPSSTPKPAM
jgi:hypothetical protein